MKAEADVSAFSHVIAVRKGPKDAGETGKIGWT